MNLIKADYIIGIALLLMLATHSITQFIVIKYTTYAQEQQEATNIIKASEANPLGALALQTNNIKYIYSFMVAPAILIGFYYYLRKKYIERNIDLLTALSIIIAVSMMLNFFNDFSYLLGFLAR